MLDGVEDPHARVPVVARHYHHLGASPTVLIEAQDGFDDRKAGTRRQNAFLVFNLVSTIFIQALVLKDLLFLLQVKECSRRDANY
jgi:hypothetical protein